MQSRAVAAFESQITQLEQRSLVEANILEQGGSPWRSFREDRKVLRPDVTGAIEHAFDCGGFVAGGCARWLRSIDKVTALKRGTYIHEGGDIDIFFRTMDGWREFVAHYAERKDDGPTLTVSEGRLATNLKFRGGKTNKPSAYSDPPLIQAICCVTGTPDEIVRSFDFHNSMVAFDREKTWVVDGWDALERDKLLKVAWWGSRSISFRVSKYMTKYGYRKLANASEAMFEQLVEATNRMSDRQKRVSRDKWLETLHYNVCDLEMKLMILASTADGIETNDLFMMTKNSVERVWCGAYENAIDHLLTRQKMANSENRDKHCSDPVGFDADEYCWAV